MVLYGFITYLCNSNERFTLYIDDMDYNLDLHIDTLKAGIMYYEKRGENPTKLKKELKRMEVLKLLTKI